MGKGQGDGQTREEELGPPRLQRGPRTTLDAQGLRHVVTINVCNREEKLSEWANYLHNDRRRRAVRVLSGGRISSCQAKVWAEIEIAQ